jgi:hypothetical protein
VRRGRPPTWTPSQVVHLRWYAGRGFSMAEVAAVTGRSYGAISHAAGRYGVSFHGQSGAPFLNRNNRRWRIRMAVKAALA